MGLIPKKSSPISLIVLKIYINRGVAEIRSSRLQMLFFKKWVFLETPTQLFPCEYCEIFKNSFFHGTPPVAALRDVNRSDMSYKNLLPNMHLFPVSTGCGLIS